MRIKRMGFSILNKEIELAAIKKKKDDFIADYHKQLCKYSEDISQASEVITSLTKKRCELMCQAMEAPGGSGIVTEDLQPGVIKTETCCSKLEKPDNEEDMCVTIYDSEDEGQDDDKYSNLPATSSDDDDIDNISICDIDAFEDDLPDLDLDDDFINQAIADFSNITKPVKVNNNNNNNTPYGASSTKHLTLVQPEDPVTDFGKTKTHMSFLSSLNARSVSRSAVPPHPQAREFQSKTFNAHKLTSMLYQLFNNTVFDNVLPQIGSKECIIGFSKKMTKTEGKAQAWFTPDNKWVQARVQLSYTGLHSIWNLVDTVFHEMAHLMVSFENKQGYKAHGAEWKAMYPRGKSVHNELPECTIHGPSSIIVYKYRCGRCHFVNKRVKRILTKTFKCKKCKFENRSSPL